MWAHKRLATATHRQPQQTIAIPLLPPSQTIALHQMTTDRYGRTIAEAYRDGQSVGLTLVSEGHAVVYNRYLDSCAETEGEYLAAEGQAQEKRLHCWSQEAIVVL